MGEKPILTEGLCGEMLRIRIGFRRIRNIVLRQPLSHFALWAQNDSSPYTGEPLVRCKLGASNYNLSICSQKNKDAVFTASF